MPSEKQQTKHPVTHAHAMDVDWGRLLLGLGYAAFLALMVLFPYYSIRGSRNNATKQLEHLSGLLAPFKERVKDRDKEYVKFLVGQFHEVENRVGTRTRITLAIAIFALLSILVFHAILIGYEWEENDLEGEVVGAVAATLGSLLATVVGFYFGGRQAEKRLGATDGATDLVGDATDEVRRTLDNVLDKATDLAERDVEILKKLRYRL